MLRSCSSPQGWVRRDCNVGLPQAWASRPCGKVAVMGSVLGYLGVGLVVVAALSAWVSTGWSRVSAALTERRIDHRHQRAIGAAWEAAEDEPVFAPDTIEATIRQLVGQAERSWGTVLPGAHVVNVAWELLRVVNREGTAEDRVVVRVRVTVAHDRRARRYPLDPTPWLTSRRLTVDERWTLGVQDGGWVLIAGSRDPHASLPLTTPLIATPAADTDRLGAESLQELAQTDRAFRDWSRTGTSPGAELLDRSLVDGRYAPALLDAAITRIVEAWEVAASGDDHPLRAVATDAASDMLLHPRQDPHNARLIVRDLQNLHTEVLDLDDLTAQVAVHLRAVRFLVSRNDNTHMAGDPEVTHTMQLRWTLKLRDAAPTQWELIDSTDPFTAPEPPMRSIRIWDAVLQRGRRPR